jgi:replication-associated recombination protein RarA
MFESIQTITKTTYNDVVFEYNQQFCIFDMVGIASNFSNFVEYLYSVSQNKVLFDKKLFIIVKNIHLLNKYQQSVLSSVIEAQKQNTIVCTTTILSKIVDRVKSRVFCKRLAIQNMSNILKLYSKDQGIDDQQLIKDILKQNKDLYSSVLHLHTGMYVNVVEVELNGLINSIKKTKNVSIYITKIREVFYKLIVYNLPHKLILNALLICLEKKYMKSPTILCYCITELCKLDHNVIMAAKPIYHYEHFFLKIYKAVNTKQ